MVKYIVKRILLMIPIILGISFVIFSLLEISPSDAAQIMLGANATPESLNALRERLGLNDPFLTRYVRYILNALQGNFGVSWRTGLPVLEEIAARLPTTVSLAVGSMILTVVIGIPIGVMSAVKQYSALDNCALAGALLLSSMPEFWLGTMMILLFSLKLRWLPAMGDGTFRSFLMPWIAMSAASMATIVRMTRSSMLEVIRADYIKMARAKGAAESRVIMHHALRNALLPVITVVGMNFAKLLGGAMIIETVFTLPGLGALALTSVRQLDVPMVMAEVLFIAIIAGFTNLLVDVLYVYIDPRLKSQYVHIKKAKN